jgi:hypothetical protein
MKKFSLTTAYFLIAGLFIAGIGTAMAFTVPGTPPAMPNPNIFDPITTNATAQRKTGGIVAKSLIAGSGIATSATAPIFTWDSFVMAKTLAAAPYGLFMSDHALVAGTSSKVKIGNNGTVTAPLIPSQYTTPLTLDLTGRTTSTATARNAQEFISGNSCNASIGANTSAIRFVDNQSPASNNNDSHTIDLIGRQVRLSGGNAAGLRVLVATNDKGDAVWGTLTIEQGKVKVNYDRSPVTDTQLCTTTPPGPTYHWDTGAWACNPNPTWQFADYPNGQVGQTCSAWLSQNGLGTQLRSVVCKDNTNTIVSDSLCPQPKPATSQPSALCPVQFRSVDTLYPGTDPNYTHYDYNKYCIYAGGVGMFSCIKQTTTATYKFDPQQPVINGVTNPRLSTMAPTAGCAVSDLGVNGPTYGPPGSSSGTPPGGGAWAVQWYLQVLK